jgi:hypothetical protein
MLLLLGLGWVAVPGCSSVYAPLSPVAPLQREAGEVSLGGNVCTVHPRRGATAYLAVAPTEIARVYVAGGFSRAREEKGLRNDTDQVEVGAGGAAKLGVAMFETLAGVGIGRTDAQTCTAYGWFGDDCIGDSPSKSTFVRGFLQETVGFRRGKILVQGLGLRFAVMRYAFSELNQLPSHHETWAVTLEPFAVTRVGFDWGKLEVGFHLPFVVPPNILTTRDRLGLPEDRRADSDLFSAPAPRLTIGVITNLDRLWREPSAAASSESEGW